MAADVRIEIEGSAALAGPHMIEAEIGKFRKDSNKPNVKPLGHDAKILVAPAGEAAENDARGITRHTPHPIDIEIPINERAVARQQLAHALKSIGPETV